MASALDQVSLCWLLTDGSSVWSVLRNKGEDNTVMVDYVLPDFSSIKKGFCKVRLHQRGSEELPWS